jgi:hypothetical protein
MILLLVLLEHLHLLALEIVEQHKQIIFNHLVVGVGVIFQMLEEQVDLLHFMETQLLLLVEIIQEQQEVMQLQLLDFPMVLAAAEEVLVILLLVKVVMEFVVVAEAVVVLLLLILVMVVMVEMVM